VQLTGIELTMDEIWRFNMSKINIHEALAGSWIVDAGPGQIKLIATYSPMGGGKFAATESALNFDWTMGGMKPEATHGSTTNGVAEVKDNEINFVLITYALDASGKAVYMVKSTGSKVFKDENTISVENLVYHIYNDPENCNPVTDAADFTVPPSGTYPPVKEYRIRL
jgi:hypothetical protein